MVQVPSIYILPEPKVAVGVWSPKISWIKNFTNVRIIAKFTKYYSIMQFPTLQYVYTYTQGKLGVFPARPATEKSTANTMSGMPHRGWDCDRFVWLCNHLQGNPKYVRMYTRTYILHRCSSSLMHSQQTSIILYTFAITMIVCTHARACTHTHIYVHTYCMYVCMYVCMH